MTVEEGWESATGEERAGAQTPRSAGGAAAPAGAERGALAPPAEKGGGACRPRAAPGLRWGRRDTDAWSS